MHTSRVALNRFSGFLLVSSRISCVPSDKSHSLWLDCARFVEPFRYCRTACSSTLATSHVVPLASRFTPPLLFDQPLGLQFLTMPPMVEWVSACVDSRFPKGGLIFRYRAVSLFADPFQRPEDASCNELVSCTAVHDPCQFLVLLQWVVDFLSSRVDTLRRVTLFVSPSP